jgi:hypothetical protein
MVLAGGCVPQRRGEGAAANPGAVSELTLPTEKTSSSATEKSFVMDWLVLGPFKFGEADFGGDQQQPAAAHAFVRDEAALDGTQVAPPGAAWKANHFAGNAGTGQVDLDSFYGAIEHAAAYAVAWLDCPEDRSDLKLYVGSDDYLKIWINGKLVHTYDVQRRASSADQDVVKGIRLAKGLNRVVVKCVDVVFDWDFYLRLTDAKDKPVAVKAKGK